MERRYLLADLVGNYSGNSIFQHGKTYTLPLSTKVGGGF